MLKPPITPEEARELLENATPGPWEHDGYGSIGNYESRQIVAVSGPDIKDDPQVVADRNAIIATPDALAIVAGLRVEYAVQNADTGAWLREEGDGVVVRTSDPSAADWNADFEEVRAYAVWMMGEELTEYRVMARYVTTNPWEVVGK